MHDNPSREAFVSVTVGFSQATTPLLGAAPGATKLDGTPAEGGADSIGVAGLFGALLAMLAPAAPTPEAATAEPTAPATTPGALLSPAGQPAAETPAATPPLPQLSDPQKPEQAKALLKDFTAALKAAKAALDEGRPLDPALEKKLEDTAAAITAWFAGQPLPAAAPVDPDQFAELVSGSALLPVAPAGDLPDLPAPAHAPSAEAAPGTVDPAGPGAPIFEQMQARIIPAKLAEFRDALQDFAAQLESTSPDLARVLTRLADRIGVGDIPDDVLARLGLNRTLASTSPELDQLVAALTAKLDAKPAPTPQPPIATPTLGLPEALAAAMAGEAEKTEVPQPDAAKPEAKAEPLHRSAEVEFDTEVRLDTKPAKADEIEPADGKAKSAPAADVGSKPASSVAPTSTPTAAPSEASTPTAQAAAATAARAIHAAYAAPLQQLNLRQVAFEVARQFEAGNTRFQIRLDPPELGRIDVKLDLDKHGTVSARMFVERPETLDLMLRDQRTLQQALQQAGLDGSKTSLEFSLRQNPFAGTGPETGQGGGDEAQASYGPSGTPVVEESGELPSQTLYRGAASASGINLFV